MKEVGKLTAAGIPEQARIEDLQRERQVAFTGEGASGGDERFGLSPAGRSSASAPKKLYAVKLA